MKIESVRIEFPETTVVGNKCVHFLSSFYLMLFVFIIDVLLYVMYFLFSIQCFTFYIK